jgi:hypothetical protein
MQVLNYSVLCMLTAIRVRRTVSDRRSVAYHLRCLRVGGKRSHHHIFSSLDGDISLGVDRNLHMTSPEGVVHFTVESLIVNRQDYRSHLRTCTESEWSRSAQSLQVRIS